MSELTLKNINKSFGDNLVLDNINLNIAEGELIVLLGASGCGKSTLLRLIAGLEELTSGEIYFGDERIDLVPPKDRGVAMVFQNYSLYPHMTVEKNIAFPLKIAKMKKGEIDQKVKDTAAMLDLSDKLKNRPGELSGGQRQRVALGRAIVRDPSIFLLDEPLSNLDADLRHRMRSEIVELQKRLNKTLIHVTHDQIEALTMADRIVLLNKGKIEQVGTPQELYKKPATIFTSRFIGIPKINIIDGEISNGKLLPFGFDIDENNFKSNRIKIGIRPEAITLGGGALNGQVIETEYMGEQYIAKIKFNDIVLTVSSIKKNLKENELVSFAIDQSSLLFFDPKTERLIF